MPKELIKKRSWVSGVVDGGFARARETMRLMRTGGYDLVVTGSAGKAEALRNLVAERDAYPQERQKPPICSDCGVSDR